MLLRRCSAAVLQKVFPIPKILLYLYIYIYKYRIEIDIVKIDFGTAALQHCNTFSDEDALSFSCLFPITV